MDTMDLSRALREYLNYLSIERNASPNTVAAYGRDLSRYLSALEGEGITSPDGRVLGKMGHTERSGNGLYKNVPGNLYQPLFEGGVEYFK